VAIKEYSSVNTSPVNWRFRITQVVLALVVLAIVVSAVRTAFKYRSNRQPLPIPTHFAGFLKSNTGYPVVGAALRVLDSNGVDVTERTALTDSYGFYAITLKKSVDTQAQLLVTLPECTKERRLPLTRSFETKRTLPYPTDLKTIFEHTVSCGGT